MSRVLLSGFRLRLGDANFDPPSNLTPYRLCFYDSTTTQAKEVFAGPDQDDASLGSIVPLDAQGYVPVSGIWLDIGRYNIGLEQRIAVDPINGDTWQQLWMINKVQGGFADGTVDDTTIRFVDTVADIRALTGADLGGITLNTGYYSFGDGGQGQWRWIATSLETDDGGAFLKPTAQSAAVPGRWHRIMPDGTEFDARLWGAVTGQSDVSGNFRLAMIYCSRTSNDTGNTLLIPTAQYSIGTATLVFDATGLTENATSKTVSFHVLQNAYFTGSSGGSVRFTGPTIIDSKAQLVSSALGLYFDPGSVAEVNERWYGQASAATRLAKADDNGLPVVLAEEVALTADITFDNPVIIDSTGKLTMSAEATFNQGLTVRGAHRQALADGSGGQFRVYDCEIEAWWFGYGSLAGDDQAYALDYAIRNAQLSSATVVVHSLPSPKGLYSSAGLQNSGVTLRPEGFIRLYNGAILSCGGIVAGRKQIFQINGTTAAPITLDFGPIYPEWFGAKKGSNADTAFKYLSQVRDRASSTESPIMIDGGGNSYTLSNGVNLASGGVGLQFMTLNFSTTSGDSYALKLGSDADYTATYLLDHVTVNHTASTRIPTILAKQVIGLEIVGCKVASDYAIFLQTAACNDIQVRHSNIVLSDGGMLYLQSHSDPQSYKITMHDNVIEGLSNTVKTTATKQFLPSGEASFHHNRVYGTIAAGAGTIVDLADNDSLAASTYNNSCEHNAFYNVMLNVWTHTKTTIDTNDFRTTGICTNGIKFIALSAAEAINYLFIRNNQATVYGDFTRGYPNTDPAVFKCGIYGNSGANSLRTHGSEIDQANISSDTETRVYVHSFFPYAKAVDFYMSMLSSEKGADKVIAYSPVLGTGIGQDQFVTADINGRFSVSDSRAKYDSSYSGNWINWVTRIGTSYYGPQG